MIEVTELIALFKRTHGVIHAHCKGLSHSDTIILPDFHANSFNWTLGHLINSRDSMLEALGESRQMVEAERKMYERDSERLIGMETAVPLERLLSLFDASQEKIMGLLVNSPERLTVMFNEENGTTVGDWIHFLNWHETYHSGELAVLRQLAGTNDKII